MALRRTDIWLSSNGYIRFELSDVPRRLSRARQLMHTFMWCRFYCKLSNRQTKCYGLAVDHGHVEVAKWLTTTYPDALSESAISLALSAASDEGHEDMMQWFPSQRR
ncbi:hypothetical protein PHMEG_00020104 [Phytophthora megakarya]|uniref:Uncharacterized protein n=1 Tax=Phytophthora megakarya TaxID=4795 RepID=A0A225VRR7_9STRA|nr:hypothetical protein PHMEG_00020104 [Phytophthora megakarya]